MALSKKEAALRIIQQLPDDASADDILRELSGLHGSPDSPSEDEQAKSAGYHLEKRGRFTVLVPNGPVPPLTVEMVNELIEDMRREREDRWLNPSNQVE